MNIPVDNVDSETGIRAEVIKEQLVKENRLSTFQVYFDDEEAFADQRPNNHVIRIIIQHNYGMYLSLWC